MPRKRRTKEELEIENQRMIQAIQEAYARINSAHSFINAADMLDHEKEAIAPMIYEACILLKNSLPVDEET